MFSYVKDIIKNPQFQILRIGLAREIRKAPIYQSATGRTPIVAASQCALEGKVKFSGSSLDEAFSKWETRALALKALPTPDKLETEVAYPAGLALTAPPSGENVTSVNQSVAVLDHEGVRGGGFGDTLLPTDVATAGEPCAPVSLIDKPVSRELLPVNEILTLEPSLPDAIFQNNAMFVQSSIAPAALENCWKSCVQPLGVLNVASRRPVNTAAKSRFPAAIPVGSETFKLLALLPALLFAFVAAIKGKGGNSFEKPTSGLGEYAKTIRALPKGRRRAWQ